MHVLPQGVGWIEVVCGPMFSGKTEELIRRLRRALFARQQVQVFKPVIDTRYDASAIVSHSEQRLEAIPVKASDELLERVSNHTVVVGIDEAQFLDAGLVDVVRTLAAAGKRVIAAGLDLDYRCEPFEPMPQLMAEAETVTKTLAICLVCGNPASRTQRTTGQEEQVVVGAAEAYEARCRRCHRLEAVAAVAHQGQLFAAC